MEKYNNIFLRHLRPIFVTGSRGMEPSMNMTDILKILGNIVENKVNYFFSLLFYIRVNLSYFECRGFAKTLIVMQLLLR